MRLADPELQRLLAGRYVIGTLRGQARRRFESYMAFQPALKQAVETWEQQLQPLVEVLPPEQPREAVWQGLQDRLWGTPAAERGRSAFGWIQGLTYAVVAVIALGIGWQLNTPEIKPPPLHLAVLNSDQGVAGYMICTDARTGRTAIEVIQSGSRQAQSDHELWLLPADSSAPRSLGLMPASGRKVIDFPETLAPLLKSARGLAVSREPAGGSPSAGPTGPILYTGPVRNMWFPKKSSLNTASDSWAPSYRQIKRDEQDATFAALGTTTSDDERLMALVKLLHD